MAWILVVDDEPAVRGALVAQLRALGHRCIEASNGLEGLERLHERDVDLILTDVMMPHLNGFQFLERALPYIEGRTPVVVLSSVEDVRGVDAALQAGAYDWLTKPAELHAVERVVQQALARRRESLRLMGPHRGRGGPVPREALGQRPGDRDEAPPSQRPAGVPAFRVPRHMVQVPRPGASDHDAPQRLSWWRRLLGGRGRGAA